MKNSKWKLMISSALILSPILFGLAVWDSLPAQMATHWGADGTVNGWSSKAFAVIGLPVILLALHGLCIFFTANDPRNKNQNPIVYGMVLWICPVISLFVAGVTYADAFGREPDINMATLELIGALFLVFGNYLPKCRQNYSIGIKIIWTLGNEENWNATHRISGKLWVAGGLLLMICGFLPARVTAWAVPAILVFLAAAPFFYSWQYHRRQIRGGG